MPAANVCVRKQRVPMCAAFDTLDRKLIDFCATYFTFKRELVSIFRPPYLSVTGFALAASCLVLQSSAQCRSLK